MPNEVAASTPIFSVPVRGPCVSGDGLEFGLHADGEGHRRFLQGGRRGRCGQDRPKAELEETERVREFSCAEAFWSSRAGGSSVSRVIDGERVSSQLLELRSGRITGLAMIVH